MILRILLLHVRWLISFLDQKSRVSRCQILTWVEGRVPLDIDGYTSAEQPLGAVEFISLVVPRGLHH